MKFLNRNRKWISFPRILFIAVPVLIIVLGTLFIQIYLRSTLTGYVENLLEEKIASHLDQVSGDSLHVKVQKLKFKAFPITVSTPEISIYADTDVYNEDDLAMQNYIYVAGVINLEISLKPLVLIALGRQKFNFNRLQADSVYFITKSHLEEPEDVLNPGLNFQSGPIHFKGKIVLPNQESNAIENFTFEKHSFKAANLSLYMPQNLSSYHIDNISIDGIMNTINMENIKILPLHSKEGFYQHIDFETDRVEVTMDDVEIRGFLTYKKHGRRGLMVSQVNIRNGLVDVFRDRRPPFNEEQRRAMPTRLILSAPVDLYVAEINVSETDILYSEYPEKGSESGFYEAVGNVPFKRLKATLRNITNIADSLHKDSIMHISAEAFIFDVHILRADFKYNLKDINGGYSVDGELSEFQFENINSAIYPLAGIKVAAGIHKSSVFTFTGNDVESNGELYMEWNGLSLEFTPDAGMVIAVITKSLGKKIYHQSNPDNVNKSPPGDIHFERDIRRFVFHYWWNCYLTGIKNSVLRDFVPL